MKKLTKNEFIEKARAIHPDYNWSLVEYIGTHIKVKIICPKHGIFESTPHNVLVGRGCVRCAIESYTSNTREFIKRVKIIHPNYDWSLVDYKNSKTKIKVICPKHGFFESLPNSLLNGVGCSKCGIEKISISNKMTQKEFIELAIAIHPSYDWSLVDYKGSKKKIKVICPIHNIFEITPNSILQGHGCIKCCGTKQSNTLEFINKVKYIHPNYDWSLVDYKTAHIKIKVICPKHGIFDTKPNWLLCGRGCPRCKESKGEKFVAKWLQDNNYEYTPQKKFKTCKNLNSLPFDFHINKTNILIEYDGIQHYTPIDCFGGEESFNNIVKHDNIKNDWAKENNYKIIRLNYLMSNQERLDMMETIKLV